ncbi:MAG: 23S rRNA (uracil(1939)-C(5))-methyltransferase RlmD, partial [Erysipelotrichaceae bacterium]|nr:23S rRNA (uracil(1939)-C(5))-methyltransferase RlmD [Erysipelotrichaceae bacterium]
MKTLDIKIDHLTKDGVGVVRIEKKPMYIMYALENEEITVNVDFEGKRNIFASILKIKDASPFRCNPKCNVYYQCGGCHLSHMTYEGQLIFKENVVKKLYAKDEFNNVTIHPCVGQDIPYFYRNKIQVPIQKRKGKLIAGFYKEDTHEIVPFTHCLVQDDMSNKIIKKVLEAMKENKIEPYNEDMQTGIVRHILIRRSEKETMLVLITKPNSFAGRNNFVQSIRKKLPEVTTIIQNINPRHTNVILGEKENILYGKGYIEDTLCGIKFKISPKSFYQINKEQCEKLYTKAIELASLTGKEVVLDAYCGIGTIGMIASKKAKTVYGVEIVEDAIKDAKINAKNNNITNCFFYCADAQDFMRKFQDKIDVVFIDPPRKGCSEIFLQA